MDFELKDGKKKVRMLFMMLFKHHEKSCPWKPHCPTTRAQNHSNIIVLQLNPPKCNSYGTTFYKSNDLINKIPCQKTS